jgi:hypothetical protein
LDLNLGDLEDVFTNPSQALAQHAPNHEAESAEVAAGSDGDDE